MRAGRFITLEGGEGVGKSTQIALIADVLRGRGKIVTTTREPGGTPGAEAIRSLLMTGGEDRWNARTEALLFAAARADHVAKLIQPALDRGEWVICDRFVDSTRAYQGGAGGVSDSDILDLHHVGCSGLLPDRTLLFDMPLTASTARASLRDNGENDRMGMKSSDYYERVAARFRDLAAAEPARFRLINADQTREGVTAETVHALADLL